MRDRNGFAFLICLIVAGLGLPRGSLADGAGVYLSVAAGPTYLVGKNLDGSANLEPDYSIGYTAGGALGYELPVLPVRLEAEVMYRRNDLDQISDSSGTILPGTGKFTGNGSVSVLSAMANGYVFLPVAFGFEPYVGAGVGYALLDVNGLSSAGVSLVDDTVDAYAYQAIAGIEFDFIPGPIDLGLEYRYFALSKERVSGSAGSFDFNYQSHSIMARLRYSF
jgi:OOP family OmpA-OmpF porin